MRLLSLATILTVISLTSCDGLNNENATPDGSNPHISINSPIDSPTFTKTNGVMINLSAVDKDEIKSLDVQIRNANGQTIMLEFAKSYSRKVVVLDTVVATNVLLPGNYLMYVTAKDKKKNVEERVTSFVISN